MFEVALQPCRGESSCVDTLTSPPNPTLRGYVKAQLKMPQIFNKIVDKDVVRQRAKTDYSHGLPVVNNHRHC